MCTFTQTDMCSDVLNQDGISVKSNSPINLLTHLHDSRSNGCHNFIIKQLLCLHAYIKQDKWRKSRKQEITFQFTAYCKWNKCPSEKVF